MSRSLIVIQMIPRLKAFHFLQAAVPDLQKELPDYLAAAEGASAVRATRVGHHTCATFGSLSNS